MRDHVRQRMNNVVDRLFQFENLPFELEQSKFGREGETVKFSSELQLSSVTAKHLKQFAIVIR